MRKLLPVGALLIVAAVLVWYFALRDRGDTAKKPVPVAKTGSAAQQPNRPQRSGDVEMQQRVQIDDDPKGDLRLEGQVIDENDAPVGGVTVVIGSNPPRQTKSEDDGS